MNLETNLSLINNTIEKYRKNHLVAHDLPKIMGVTKGQDTETIGKVIQLGITLFGENRVQEAYEKWPEIREKHPKTQLHLIGPLQTNKVGQALELFDAIQTVDRPKLSEAIAKHRTSHPSLATKQFFIQVNTGEEPQKAGILPKEADDFINYCRMDLKLPVTGLMCIPPVDDLPAPHFVLLRKIALKHDLNELSMGMSDDYETAIRMGSTCLRIGRALFGERK